MKFEYGIYVDEDCIEEYEDISSAYHQAAEYTRESGIFHKVKNIHDMENEYNLYIDDVLSAVGDMDSILSILANQVKEPKICNAKETNIKIIKQENKPKTKRG